jgi:hypothetical protein
MSVTIYEVVCQVSDDWDPDPDADDLWEYEQLLHPTRESAEAVCQRLRAAGGWGDEGPVYRVAERTREDYPVGEGGEAEWRAGCELAGVDPDTGSPHALTLLSEEDSRPIG